jgi:hypothetical protein
MFGRFKSRSVWENDWKARQRFFDLTTGCCSTVSPEMNGGAALNRAAVD